MLRILDFGNYWGEVPSLPLPLTMGLSKTLCTRQFWEIKKEDDNKKRLCLRSKREDCSLAGCNHREIRSPKSLHTITSHSRSRSLDNLNETSPLHDRCNDASGHRPLRKKSVGFRDTVENMCPPDLTMYKSLDDISMIGKKGWARGKIQENPNMNLPSPWKSTLRKSPNPSPVPTDRHDVLTTV